MQENTVFPLSKYWSTWRTKRKQHWINVFRFHSCERRAGFSRHRKWRPQLAPLPPLPHPPLQGWDSGTGTSMQEDQRDLWRLQSNITKKHGLCRGKASRPMTETEAKHREGDTGKSSKVRSSHLCVLVFFFFLFPVFNLGFPPSVWILLSWNN